MLKKITTIVVLTLVLLTGCAYYNIFFNAKKYFESAQSQPLRDDGRPNPRAIQDYDKVIEKCAVILTDFLDSRWADDALFLMGKAMYYKRTQYRPSRDRFNELIKFYPESPFVPEAKIYLARIDYYQGNIEESFKNLNDFLRVDEYSKYFPKVHLEIADFALLEKDYNMVHYHLRQIIDNYPRSDEYNDAFFRLGRSYHESGKFEESNDIFNSLVRARRIPRGIVFDSRYYIALNSLELENYEEALRVGERLLRDEYRADRLPRIQVVRARAKIGLSDFDEAEIILKTVRDNNRRTALSAQANYYLGELYFLEYSNFEEAISYYNSVRTEFSNSPYVEKAVSKSAIASLIMQFNQPDRAVPTGELIEEQKKLAEFYLYDLAMPDSAMVVYDTIISQKQEVISNIDSLSALIENYQALTDSLSIAKTDSLMTVKANFEQDLGYYQTQIIPEIFFHKIWVYYHKFQDQALAHDKYNELKKAYPNHRYTYAAYLLLNNKELKIISEIENEINNGLEKVLDYKETDVSSAVDELYTVLDKARANREHISEGLYSKIIYGLGHLYYFGLNDTVQAKHYFDQLLEEDGSSSYALFIGNFYDGNSFINLEEVQKIEDTTEDIDLRETESTDRVFPEEDFDAEHGPLPFEGF